MKIKYPVTQAASAQKQSAQSNFSLLVLLALIFAAGVFFERNGGVAYIEQNVFHSFAVDQIIEEVNTESQLYGDSSLPTLYFDVPFDSMLSITEKREDALRVGILFSSDDDFVPATMHMNDEQNLTVKLRLKGDWTDHLMSSKWSFRIHITEQDGAILGMQRFSIQSPGTRNYVHEWGYHQNLMREGVLTTRYDFVNVVINGENKGVFAIEESFTEDLLEAQKRREGLILHYDENLMWTDWANGGFWPSIEDFWLTEGIAFNETVPFRGTHIEANPLLAAEYRAASDLLYALKSGSIPPSQVLDEELWGRYFAITDLWAGGHGTIWHNYRFYYNPVTGLLEPVAFDADPFDFRYMRDELAYPFLEMGLFDSVGVQKAYVATLERITTPQYLQSVQDAIGADTSRYTDTLLKEYRLRATPAAIELPWQRLAERAQQLANHINPVQPLRGNYQLMEQDGKTFLQLDLVNMLVLPIEMTSIQWGAETIPLAGLQCSGTNCDLGLAPVKDAFVLAPLKNGENALPVSFRLPLETPPHPSEDAMSLRVNLYGGTKQIDIPILTNYVPTAISSGVLPTANLEEALATHPFLLVVGADRLAIQQGNWDVNEDLILPEGYSLNIPPGTTLRFGQGISFVTRGSVDILGTEDEPVTITSQNGAWGGMLILNAKDASDWEYVSIGEMSGIAYPGTGITGGITFYRSDVNIAASRIGNNQTEDALNVIQSDFYFEKVEFLNAPSDAFDGDFTNGTVSHCSFHDILGDAVDVSGSQVSVLDSYFVTLGDKAISAGEHSRVTAERLMINDVGIGVASKDLSDVQISHSSIENAHVAGLAAYIKKPQYGAATITATEQTITNTASPAFCQTKSEIILNGESVLPQDFDVDALYAQGVLGN